MTKISHNDAGAGQSRPQINNNHRNEGSLSLKKLGILWLLGGSADQYARGACAGRAAAPNNSPLGNNGLHELRNPNSEAAFATPQAWRAAPIPGPDAFDLAVDFDATAMHPEHARRMLATGAEATPQLRARRGYLRRETQRYELVLSRYNEKLEWLRDIPDFWRITVYNTGADDVALWDDRAMEVVPLENQQFGREGYAYMHHLSTRYATLADYTVFSQAAPFEHNPYFGKMLHHPAMLMPVQPMSSMFTDTIPPKAVRDRFSPDPWFRPDKFSLRTMDSLFFEDCCIYTAGLAYSARFNVTEGSNLVNHLLSSVGLTDWVPEHTEVGIFPYGGMFGVSKRRVQQHKRDVYQRLVPKLLEHVQVGYILERTWLIMFGGLRYLE